MTLAIGFGIFTIVFAVIVFLDRRQKKKWDPVMTDEKHHKTNRIE